MLHFNVPSAPVACDPYVTFAFVFLSQQINKHIPQGNKNEKEIRNMKENKKFVFKSIINGVVAVGLVIMLSTFVLGADPVGAFFAPLTLPIFVCTVVGSFSGYLAKAKKEAEQQK